MSSKPFPNLELINKSIRELYQRLSPARIRQFNDDFELSAYDRDKAIDPVIRTQKIARNLANHFRVTVSNIVVTFRSDLPVPGSIELSSSHDFFIELHSEHRNTTHAIAAILAHEVAHIFLHQACIHLEPVFANEVLTDTTAAYLGCGITIMNGASQMDTKIGSKTQTQLRHYGYITMEEFGYIQAKRDLLFERKESPLFANGLPRAGYAYRALASGQACLDGERNQYPYSPKPQEPRLRFIDRFTRKSSRSSESTIQKQQCSHGVIFPCACCSQTLRIPILGKKLSVRCPICQETFLCYS